MSYEDYRNELKKKVENYARLNLLSNRQRSQLLKLDFDACFLEDRVEKCLKSPDIKHLQKILTPHFNSPSLAFKEIEDIERAVAIGDIIGSKYEFTEHNYTQINSEQLIAEKAFFTDDSVLSHATSFEIKQHPRHPNFRKAYLHAYSQYPDAGYGATFVRWAQEFDISNRKGYGSYGNGSAMRVASIGCYYKNIKDVVKFAVKSAMVTHNHQDGIKGAAVTAVVIWMAKNGYTKEDIEKYASRFYSFNGKDKEYLVHKEIYFDLCEPLDSAPTIPYASMFCNYAVPFAIKCFLETGGYKECMSEILKHYGDADTICAIAGGICYAYYGDINLSQEDINCVNEIIEKANFSSLAFK